MEKREKKITKFGIEASFVDAKEKCVCIPINYPSELELEDEDLRRLQIEVHNELEKKYPDIVFSGKCETKSNSDVKNLFLFYFE